jgi:Pyridoxal-dependent decarboxylase conserved domain
MAEAGAMRFGRAAGDELDCDPLALSAARMREIGYRTIDLLTERLTDRSMSAMQRGSRADLLARIPSSVPAGPRGWHELLDELDEHVLAFMSRLAHPSYFAFIPASSTFPGALDLGLQLTRTSRALKIWLSLNYFGVDAFRAAIDRALHLAEMAERLVDAFPALELVCPATLGVVCFRRRFARLDGEQLERANAQLVSAFETTGQGLLSSTRLHGRYAIRMCVMNHTSAPADVEAAVRWLATAPVSADQQIKRSRPGTRPRLVAVGPGG